MIYKKPNNVSYSDMAIYIDTHIYTDNCDEVLVFQYLYFIIDMLAHQAQYFKSAKNYDDFALTTASVVFMRLKNPKQFELDENGNPRKEKIKSVLNYIKSTLYPRKVDFEQEYYVQTGLKNPDDIIYDNELNFREQLAQTVDELSLVDFEVYLGDIARTIKANLIHIPVKKNSPEWMNIYLSCLLTLLNTVTLSNENLRMLREMKEIVYTKPYLIDKMYREEKQHSVILYHLPEDMHDYILVLTTRLKRIIARDLSTSMRTYIPGDAFAKSIISAAVDGREEDYEVETQ